MASNRVIAEIKERLDIVEIVGRYVNLKRSGRTYKALCPFHQERTPSFVVFPHTGTWHCFGACSEGGDVFSFIMKIEGLNFAEALAMLAREAGVEWHPSGDTGAQARQRRDRLRATCEAAANLFAEWLLTHPEAAACRAYLEARRIRPETARLFGLGYAPNRWEALLRALTERGYPVEDLEAAGLVVRSDSGSYYDRFRHRLIFPIRDVRGRVVGFGARALEANQEPKYLNSPQTELFDKGRLLYGLDLAKESIRNANRVVVVEGYMDVITAHQAGFRNVVASLGTALTVEQLRLIKRFTTNITLALDADDAGVEATKRGLEAARQALDKRLVPRVGRRGRIQQDYELEGDLRVAVLPPGYDPDDLIKEDPERWRSLVERALPVIDFFFEAATRGRDLNDVHQRAAVAAELMPVVAEINNVVVRAHYVQRLARLLQVSEQELHTAIRHEQRRLPLPLIEEAGAPHGEGGLADVPATEAYLMYLLMQWPHCVPVALEMGLKATDWTTVEFRILFDALAQHAPVDATTVEELLADLPPPVAELAGRVRARYDRQPPLSPELVEFEIRNRVDEVKIRALRREYEHLQHLLADVQEEEDASSDQVVALLRRQADVSRQIVAHEQARRARRPPQARVS